MMRCHSRLQLVAAASLAAGSRRACLAVLGPSPRSTTSMCIERCNGFSPRDQSAARESAIFTTQASATLRSSGLSAKILHRHSANKFDRFRVRMTAQANQESGDSDDVLSVAQDAFAVLAKKGRTWRRLGHLAVMACDDAEDLRKGAACNLPSVVDVGCDHGLLAIGLAASGRFRKVIGTDVSARALEDGALTNYRNVLDVLAPAKSQDLPVDFRVCDGLQCLEAGEADTICIAGMGVNTIMGNILFRSDNNETSPVLDRLQCKRLFLQPTNSKPRNLVRLYDKLQGEGWGVEDEKIMYLASRWYISTAFSLNKEPDMQLPGDILRSLPASDAMRQIYQDYVAHHTQWIEQNTEKKGGNILHDEARWLGMY